MSAPPPPPTPPPLLLCVRQKVESHVVSLTESPPLIKIMEGDVSRECTQRLMQAAEQIQIGQNSLIARNNMGARQESEPPQTASGPESLCSTASPRSALSAAERSAGDLERPQNKAGPAWEEHRKIFGYRLLSGASRSQPGSGNSRRRGKREPAAFLPYFHRKKTWTRPLPSTSERITLTQNSLTSVIDCGTLSKLPPNCTKCCSFCCKRNLTKSRVSSLALQCNLLDRSSRKFLSRAKKSVRSVPSTVF